MTQNYSIAEARDRFTQIVRDAESGNPVQITRHGKPVAVVLAAEEYERIKPQKTLWDAIQKWRAEMLTDHPEIDPDEIFGNIRDRSTTGGREPISFD